MATFEKGDMWNIYGKTNLFLFPANSVIAGDGRLVMGAGFAGQVKEKIPATPYRFGLAINRIHSDEQFPVYGLIIEKVPSVPHLIGAFQTKTDYNLKSSLNLIQLATKLLFSWVVDNLHQSKDGVRVDMPFPGIGEGGLSKRLVQPIVSLLPDCVHIWEYEPQEQLNLMDVYR